MSERDAGFCSGGEELESEGAPSAASAASARLGTSGDADADADEALSPTDASEDSVEVRVRAVAPPPAPPAPPPPPPPAASPPRKRRPADGPAVAPPPPKKRRLPPPTASTPPPPAPAPSAGSPFRPWSIEGFDCPDARIRPSDAHFERLRIPKDAHPKLPMDSEVDRRYTASPLRAPKSETVTSRDGQGPCERLSPHPALCLRLDPLDRRYSSPVGHGSMGHSPMGHNSMGHSPVGHNSMGHSPRLRLPPEAPDRLRLDSLETAERLRVSPGPHPRSVKLEPPPTPGSDDTTSRFAFPPCTSRSLPSAPLPPHPDRHLSPERLRVKAEPSSTPARSRSGSADSRAGTLDAECPRARVKSEAAGGFSVAALLGGGGEAVAGAGAGAGTSGHASPSPSTSSGQPHGQAQGQAQQRNYKNMTRERRIEANARERTRVHTISAAFDTLRRAVPAYSHAQKLSKLSVLRVACAYILTLSRAAGKDYSADGSQPSLESCVDLVTRTIHTEGKLRRKRDD